MEMSSPVVLILLPGAGGWGGDGGHSGEEREGGGVNGVGGWRRRLVDRSIG